MIANPSWIKNLKYIINFRSKNIYFRILFRIFPEQFFILYYVFVPIHPEFISQKYISNSKIPRFLSHISIFLILSEQFIILYFLYKPIHPKSKFQNLLQISDPKIFISYICFEFFRNNSSYYNMFLCQSILNLFSQFFSQNLYFIYPSFKFYRNNLPYYTLYIIQSILN